MIVLLLVCGVGLLLHQRIFDIAIGKCGISYDIST